MANAASRFRSFVEQHRVNRFRRLRNRPIGAPLIRLSATMSRMDENPQNERFPVVAAIAQRRLS